MGIFQLKTHDPSGSGYIGTLQLEDRQIYTEITPHPPVQRLVIKVIGWSVWQREETGIAFLTDDEAEKLRDALGRYLMTRQRHS